MRASSTHRSNRRTVVAERLEDLVAPLVEVLGSPLDDPMIPEWIAVPSSVLQRWLSLQLAGHLGAAAGRADGISANITFARPSELWWIVLDADDRRLHGRPPLRPGARDHDRRVEPWSVEAVTWHVLAAGTSDPALAITAGALDGHADLAWARRVAQVITGYDRTRPAMLRAWAAGDDTDPDGARLPVNQQWQPRLWRAVRERIGRPGPAERLPMILDDLATGRLEVPLPDRISLFAPTTLPGGSNYVELLDAVAAHRQVDVHLTLPSVELLPDDDELAGLVRDDGTGILRRDERARFRGPEARAIHPLLDSWGSTARETALLVGPRDATAIVPDASDRPATPTGMLSALQGAVRHGGVPEPVSADGLDVDVHLHACTGTMRQAEVLRDAVVHLLAEDPTLTEEDVLVVCPDPDRFGPAIRTAFDTPTDDTGAPSLHVSAGHGRGGTTDPVAGAMQLLVTSASGPFRVGEMLEFCGSAPVARRYGFDDDALAQLRAWFDDNHVRWGLTPVNRAGFGVPESYARTTFRAAADSLLVGLALSGGDVFDGVTPDPASASRSTLVGSFADLLVSLTDVADTVGNPMDPRAALVTVRGWIARFLRVDDRESRALEMLLTTLTRTAEQLEIAGIDATTPVTPGDLLRHALARQRSGRSTSHLLRGGIDVAALRAGDITPHRVVAIVGLDEGALAGSRMDGDDLTMLEARVGDTDPRAEARGALLDAVTAARDHLVVIRDGTDVNTGEAIEIPIVVSELDEALDASIPDRPAAVSNHPRHASDPACFAPGAVLRGTDPAAFDVARRRAAGTPGDRRGIDWTITDPDVPAVVTLDDLHRFFDNPTKYFLQRSVDLHLDGGDEELARTLPTDLDALARWKLERTVLDTALTGTSELTDGAVDAIPADRFRRALGVDAGGLPVGRLGTAAVETMRTEVEQLLAGVPTDLRHPAVPTVHELSIGLADGVHLGGRVETFASGGARFVRDVTPSRTKAADRLRAWTTLAALVVHDPTVHWRVRTVRKPERGDGAVVATHTFRDADGDGDRRAHALADLGLAIALWRFGSARPLPYFAKLSPNVAAGPASVRATDWHANSGPGGDGDEVHVAFVYGNLGLSDLLAAHLDADEAAFIDAYPVDTDDGDDEPDGDGAEPGRVAAFARLVWSRIDASLHTEGNES